MPAKPNPTKKAAKKAAKIAKKKAKPKAAPKQPVATTIVTELTEQIDNQEITDRKGDALQPIGPDRMRLMQADVMSAIVRKFDGDKLAGLLDELSKAENITNGGHKIPDNRTRLSAATLILAYMIGRPVERQEILNINMNADAAHDLAERLKGSPSLRAAFRSILEQAEKHSTTEAVPPTSTVEVVIPAETKAPTVAKKAKAVAKKSPTLEFED